jgi:hypothetical protein
MLHYMVADPVFYAPCKVLPIIAASPSNFADISLLIVFEILVKFSLSQPLFRRKYFL